MNLTGSTKKWKAYFFNRMNSVKVLIRYFELILLSIVIKTQGCNCIYNSQIWEPGMCLLSVLHTLIHIIALDRVHFQEETIKLPAHRWGYYGQFWYEQPNCNGNTLHSEAWNADAWLCLLQTSISITLLNRMFLVMCTTLPYHPTLLCRFVAPYTLSQQQNAISRSQVWWIGRIIPLPTWFACFSDLLQ